VATVTSGTSYQDTNLTPNTTYAYTVCTYDQAGNNSPQTAPLNVNTLPLPDTTPPSVPANLVTSGITSTSMLISWSASTDNVGVAGYRVSRNGTQVATVTSGTSYQNTNLTPATAYTYTVQAYDQAGNNSAQSSPLTATTLPPSDTTPPSVPTNLVASGITSTTVTISWTASTDNIGVVGYRVYRNGTQVATATPGTSYQDTNLTANTTYAYIVSAYDQAGNSSAQSAALNVTTTGTPPPPVYSVPLAWDAPTTNVDGSPLTNLAGYWLYYGTSSGVFTTNINIGNVTTYTISNLPYGTYYFAIKAYNSTNNFSDYSSPTYGLCVNVDATPSVCIH
jgi:chitodextrinase